MGRSAIFNFVGSHDMTALLRETIKNSLIERGAEVDMMLLGILSRQHVLFVGPPGTAKSMMVDNLMAAIDGVKGFSALMHKFVPPEETVGPLKLSELKNDKYERQTQGYLPEADLAFLDEIWKSSASILNTLLRLLNERQFRNGNVTIDTPLRSAIAASNEYPIGESFATTGALFDRFLLRSDVKPVSQGRWNDLVFGTLPKVTPVTTLADLDALAAKVPLTPWSLPATKAYMDIASEVIRSGVQFGDRRLRASAGVCQASAVLNGNAEVEVSDLEPLKYTLWVHPDQQHDVAKIVLKVSNPGGQEVLDIISNAEELFAGCTELRSPETFASLKKIQVSIEKLNSMKDNAQATEAKTMITNRLQKLSHEVFGINS
jgi:MoxR-like ATPase